MSVTVPDFVTSARVVYGMHDIKTIGYQDRPSGVVKINVHRIHDMHALYLFFDPAA